MVKVAVVIPYFQRTPGLLKRGLESIYAQDVGPDVAVEAIVIDDESPSPPEIETSGLVRENFAITIVKRPNGGPGKARNTGLEHLGGADYVAFLDSDDWWAPRHLSTAIRALRDGAGFYFANNIPDPHTTWFKELHSGEAIIAASEVREGGVRRIATETLLRHFLVECVAHTSTVVIDTACIAGKRFDEDQAKAGEDYLFWLEATRHTPYAAFSLEQMASRGRGIDHYRGGLDWSHPECIRGIYYNLTLRKKIRSLYCRTDEQRRTLSGMINRLRREILYLFVRNATAHVASNAWVLSRLLLNDLAFFLLLPYNAAVTIRQKMENRLDFVVREASPSSPQQQ